MVCARVWWCGASGKGKEFQEGSRELEHELESQLEQAEAKMKELKSLSNK